MPFELFTDTSSIGIEAEEQRAEEQRPIAYAFRTLNNAERNYTVSARKYLEVIWTLNKFRTYFGPLPLKVITDHATLTKLNLGKNLSSRMIRLVFKLAEFHVEQEHRPGAQNVVADILSRNLVENIACVLIRDFVLSSREQLILEQRQDPELGHIYRYLETPDDSLVNATIVWTSSSASTKQIKKRARKTKKNFGQVPAEDSRPGPEKEGSFQSSQIQQGKSSPYNIRSRRVVTREADFRPSGRLVQAQEGPIRSRRDQFRRSSLYHSRLRRQSRQGHQESEESLRSRRSTSLEVHVGDITERR
ncbi:retrovirus-related Pol polyprotein from transposon 17.6 [Trichonephila clavipes]|uniref:Retrovirus-related Pol polyprotein from transposon 17.6 n=1 Tax=Trichonephila clavipes TaxID=2585209 RepID=A0A8X7BL89_TRICX|nr:retrovirus-related Pol polyprotein from transposon 17.6 [Trichonephila clavipes]